MRGWRQRERQQMRDGQAGGRGGRTGRKGRGKAQGTQVARAQCIAANGVGAKKHPPQNFKDASICPLLHVIAYTFTSLLASLGGLIAIPTNY